MNARIQTIKQTGVALTPSPGDIVQFGSFSWEVSSVEAVSCEYDPDYHFRVNLIRRNEDGEMINFATGIPNY